MPTSGQRNKTASLPVLTSLISTESVLLQYKLYHNWWGPSFLVILARIQYSLVDRVRVIMFNATFNNISVISWRSALLVEETGVPEKNHRPASHWKTLSHNVVSSTTLVVISTNCTYSCISNFHTITTTTSPVSWLILRNI
jgi:hypothetical protein